MAPTKSQLERYIREHIVRAREQAGMTQEELGKAIGKTNVSISDIERGRVGVSAIDLINIARTLNQPLNHFVPRTARISIPKQDLSTDEEKLVNDFRRIIYTDLSQAILNLTEKVAIFSDKSEVKRLGQEYIALIKLLTGRD